MAAGESSRQGQVPNGEERDDQGDPVHAAERARTNLGFPAFVREWKRMWGKARHETETVGSFGSLKGQQIPAQRSAPNVEERCFANGLLRNCPVSHLNPILVNTQEPATRRDPVSSSIECLALVRSYTAGQSPKQKPSLALCHQHDTASAIYGRQLI